MSVTEMWIILACAAIGAALIVSAVIRGSRNMDEGLKRLRLGLNIVLLILYRTIWAVALALFAIGWYRGNTDLWYAAFFVLLMGLLLFRDLSARNANPLREWFSSTPDSDRLRSVEQETARLSQELSHEARPQPSWEEADGDARSFAEEFRRAADRAARGEVRTEEGGRTTRTWSFTFEWPPRRPKR